MSTDVNEVPTEATEATESSAHLTVAHVTYRTYGAYTDKGEAVGYKKDKDGNFTGTPSILSETSNKENWKRATDAGGTVLNQNQFKFYTLNDIAGFETLVPSEEQRLYVIQKGLDALQTAAANAIQVKLREKNAKEDPDEFLYNEDTIDLRNPAYEGAPSINTPPQRKSLTDSEKFMRAAAAVGDPAKLQAMLTDLLSKLQSEASA